MSGLPLPKRTRNVVGAMAAQPLETEEWQPQFLELAHILGWEHMFVRKSIGKGRKWTTATNRKGWPDLYLWHEGQRRRMHVELKRDDTYPTPDQRAMLATLAAAGAECYVLRPRDLEMCGVILRRVPEPDALPSRVTPWLTR